MFGSSVLGSIYTLSTCFIQIYQGGKGKNGSTVAVSCSSFAFFYVVHLKCNFSFLKSFLDYSKSIGLKNVY